MNTYNYAKISPYYERWCSGDEAYLPSCKFYIDFLSSQKGVFAELGIGTGRIALPLSKLEGIKIFGIDNCHEMLEVCRRHIQANMNLELLLSDFLTFDLPIAADIIYMPFRTIGHILDDDDLKTLFFRVKHNLKANGRFLFDHYIFDKNWADAHNGIDRIMFQDNETCIVDHYIYDFDKKVMHCNVVLNGTVVERFDFRWIEPHMIQSLFSQCGFICEKLYGDYDYSDWTEESPNQIWLLRNEG